MTLLFEIGTEELPSWYILQSQEDIATLLKNLLSQHQIQHGRVHSYATPRRIAVAVEDMASTNTKRTELKRGPAINVAYDAEGKLTKAALGFAKANNIAPENIIRQDTDKGSYIYAEISLGGEDVRQLLPEILKTVVEDLPAPRKMRWANVVTPFVRPVAWLLAMLDHEVISVEAAGLTASNQSYGHRFLSPEAFTLHHAKDYLNELEKRYVIADVKAREEKTLETARGTAQQAGLTLQVSESLIHDISHIVEYPFGILGRFDRNYLDLPEEVLATTMIHHQRFFPTRDDRGKLSENFVGISNNKVLDETVVRQGYEQVLAGRLYDAKFFWDTDQKKSLKQHAWGLGGIAFQKELGSMGDKVSRVGVTAKALAERLNFSEGEHAILEEALPIFRADLATQMVGELPELEGVMNRAYALAEKYSPEVATALEEGVLPKGTQDALPHSQVGAVLSVADRLDKLVGFFAINKRPSGSADPFALRRDAIGLVRILNSMGWDISISELIETTSQSYSLEVSEEAKSALANFIWDRAQGLLSDESIRVELIRAATADNPSVLTATQRCHLLQALSENSDFPALMTLYRRAATLANQAPEKATVDTKQHNDYETALHTTLPQAQAAVISLLEKSSEQLGTWDLGNGPDQTLTNLDQDISQVLSIKAPLDAFLDNVMVMVEDSKIKNSRLALLREVRNTLRALGKLEELEGL
jgi:glycyl-tRNA synthetase beta chain